MYREYADENHFPGYAYGIVQDSRLMHSGAGGYANLENKIPATPKSMFRIASMTKSFTAMAVLKLRDENRLRLEDPVHLYIPEIRNQKLTLDAPDITIRDLLIHSAGFPTDDPWGDRKLDQTEAEFLALIKNGLSFSTTTGTTFEYSNLGYAILGVIITKVTGIPYETYIDSLGIKETSWDFTKTPHLAQGYRWTGNEWRDEPLLGPGVFGAMGGLIASVDSFSAYIALHQAAWPPRDDQEMGPVKRSTLREMHHPRIFSYIENEMTHMYGYGLRCSRDNKGRTFIGHSGGLPGFGSNWMFIPEYGIGVILLANVTYAWATKINLTVLNKLAEQLKPITFPPSAILKERQNALVKMLPNWQNAPDIFAINFFADYPALQEETEEQFAKMGSIISIDEIIPENHLAGHFIMHGENADLQITIGLTPENPPLIQKYQVKVLGHSCP